MTAVKPDEAKDEKKEEVDKVNTPGRKQKKRRLNPGVEAAPSPVPQPAIVNAEAVGRVVPPENQAAGTGDEVAEELEKKEVDEEEV